MSIESLHVLRVFVAVCEERSFTAAAAREGLTQPGVSQHIRNLEAQLGVRLISRGLGELVPTPAGHAYYQSCLTVLRSYEDAMSPLDMPSNMHGELAVGLTPTMTRAVLAPTLSAFATAHPDVRVKVVEGYGGNLTAPVRAADLDFAIVPTVPAEPAIRQQIFARTREVLVMRGDAAGPALAPVRISELGPLKLVLAGRQNARRLGIESYLAANMALVERRIELDSMSGTLDLVANSDWCAIIPALVMARDIDTGRFLMRPLASPPLWVELVLISPSRKSLSPAAAAFLDVLRTYTREIGAQTANRLGIEA